MKLNNNRINYLILVLAIGIISLIIFIPSKREESKKELYTAKIIDVIERQGNDNMGHQTINITYSAEITDQRFGGKIINVMDVFEVNVPHLEAEAGDEVLLYLELDESGLNILNAYINGYKRDQYIIYLVLIFVFLVLAIGRVKGLKALLSLVLTVLLVIKAFLPGILKGYSPIILSILIATAITTVTLLIISGFSKKTLTAIIGTLTGVFIAGVIAYSFSSYSKLIGFSYEEIQLLSFIPQGTKFDFNGLLFSSILLGALGAVMDVSMSISSAIVEIKTADPSMSLKQLFKSGMNIGRDIMGTMVNTLVLAYTGSSLNLMILILAYNKPLIETINYEMIIVEILRALAGTIGLVITIPFTAFLGAFLATYSKKRSEKVEE